MYKIGTKSGFLKSTSKIMLMIVFAFEHCSSVPLMWTWSSLMFNSLTPVRSFISFIIRPFFPIISPVMPSGIGITSSWYSVLTALSYQLGSPSFLRLRGSSLQCSESRDMAIKENKQFRKMIMQSYCFSLNHIYSTSREALVVHSTTVPLHWARWKQCFAQNECTIYWNRAIFSWLWE